MTRAFQRCKSKEPVGFEPTHEFSPIALAKQPLYRLSKTPCLVWVTGLEPARLSRQGILSPLCLPIPSHPHKNLTEPL